MKHIFVVNPVSGKQDAGKAMIPPLRAAAQAAGLQPVFEMTQAPKHATQIAQKYGDAGEEAFLYSVGGDGTFNEVLTGAYPFPQLAVGCIPCGSGNDFVRSYGEVEDFLDLPGQLAGTPVSIDLMAVDGGICAAITSTGLDAEVAYNIPKYRRIPLLGGTMAYNISIAEKLLKPLGKHLRIEIDGQVHEGRYLIATVCNGQTYGGGYRAAPMAKLDDGMLEVILVKKVSRLRLASIIGKYKKGRHYANGAIIPELADVMQHFRAREVTIVPTGNEPFILNVDGECGPAPRLYAKVMPLAARFILPKGLHGAVGGTG